MYAFKGNSNTSQKTGGKNEKQIPLHPTPPRRTEAVLSLKLRLSSAKLRMHRVTGKRVEERMTTNNSAVLHFLTLFQLGRNGIVRKGQNGFFFSTCVKRLTKKSTKKAVTSQLEFVAVYLDVPPSGVLRSHLGIACAQGLLAVLIPLLQKSPLLISDTAV